MAGAIAISLLNPLLIEEALDNYIARRDFEGLVRLGILALALNLVYIVLVKIRMYEMSVVSNKILLRIRQDLYEHIQTLSFSFFDSRPTGKILARIIGDVNALKDVFVNAVTTLIPEFVTVAGVVVIMVAKDWRLAAASLSTLPIMAAGVWMVQKASHRRWQIYRKKSSNLNAYVHEDLAGMRVVQSFQAQDEMNEIFSKLTDEHRDSFQDACRYADLFGPVVDFCWGIGAMMLYLVGVRVLGIGQASVGLLVAFGSYINMFWNPILNLSSFYNNLITNLTAAERILTFWIHNRILRTGRVSKNCRRFKEVWNFLMSVLRMTKERRRRQKYYQTSAFRCVRVRRLRWSDLREPERQRLSI
ncbi:hypothetical protein C823_006595 [Eubacterium plexicaudatum ASF492]|nr:hypothetical protein C823_006595 [Eubacterium plexicaudatum ASF492]